MALIRKSLQAFALAACLATSSQVQAQPVPAQQSIGDLETVAEIHGAMPTGIAVSTSGRIFINYPRWGDDVQFTVAEIVDGKPLAFPNTIWNQQGSISTQSRRIVSAQSVVIDPSGIHLWIVDTGSLRPHPISYGGPKLIQVSLENNKVLRTILIEPEALTPETYLNDVRFLFNSNTASYAFISDSSPDGGIIVVNLVTGESWRRLSGTSFTRSDPSFVPVVEAEVLMIREPGESAKRFNVGSDGIAVSADGETVFFRSLTSRHLYSVPTEALINRTIQEENLKKMVVDHGQVAGASDGLEADSSGGIFLTDYEHNAIHRFTGSISTLKTLMYSPQAIWPDSLALADDGYLYFTANQLNRQSQFHQGIDKRIQPYMVFRIKTPYRPIRHGQQPNIHK
ncbi:L-dopachrome tautomerase-related protein [Synechococcus sp. NOUM97013]|uniref:L-dopachrome tautomerase-related protein n=1 Tax=Synechococcus sp. NOUM97013 TaxID=1442555 RepID=UPI001646CD2E|nr:L-dopachrome tautomerase-related protein [Synechococcus sp. NOUM97013]QNI72896.1 major royal jelly family protein [Synechococcus sp. NOUM97013]